MQIQIFITGGTFDKEYNELNGDLYFRDTHLKQMLEQGRSQLNVNIRSLMMIDSLEMTEQDREIILTHCQKSTTDRIVITHGTDTMVDTAHYLAEHIKDKTIILTGAMIPIVFGSSDGLFNMGAALAYVQTLGHGIYLAMNGQYFNYDNVRKNKAKGLFETL
ncbi:MAG: asparaginase [Candidatus Marinimicrobia bacterium]|jgi:L-asparaginase|nr:asparaginase [Candidatus Neomarinimicrobiota bacterium]MBT3632381.1 asparaginase [Candidatus Neomarinimicrobiota bacterium]MBT3825829.1 asparaginase [Candidatus Neomarinimicrobiota bacterium]MBT4129915.1 asparaginase [Candidatus Neomarinimicrobiota bacterium]MBT4294210.1 asparaginase [Candidatus Neomarinimicrobiota bacterium]